MGFDVAQFAASKAKPLPIILLLDESGSMSGDKIDKLNEADLVNIKAAMETLRGSSIHVIHLANNMGENQ